jgi:type I restriction enzyme, S subunit
MVGEWTTARLAEVAAGIQTGPFGSQLHASDYVASGVPVVMPTNIRDRRIDREGINYIRDEDANRLSRHRLRQNDLVFSRRGEVDKCALVTQDTVDWLCGTGCLLVRPDDTKCDPAFLSFHISAPETRDWLNQHAVGLVMLNLNTEILSNIPLNLPPLTEQRRIADLLGSLDDKIELNRRKAATLDEMARALFKNWFVDFEPVRAKDEGRSTGLPAATAAIFPNQFGKGGNPEGWGTARLGSLIELVYGRSLKADVRRNGQVPVYGSNGRVGLHDQALVEGPGIVVGRKGNPGTVTYTQEPFFPIDTTFYVAPRRSVGMPYLYYLMKRARLEDRGGDSAVPGLNRDAAYSIEVVAPPDDVCAFFSQICDPLLLRMAAYHSESETLASLRDTLLPKLISGKLRINDVAVKEVAA